MQVTIKCNHVILSQKTPWGALFVSLLILLWRFSVSCILFCHKRKAVRQLKTYSCLRSGTNSIVAVLISWSSQLEWSV